MVSGLSYDANGNILSMNQHGFKVGSPGATIDSLVYSYQTSSNKLSQITDAANDSLSQLGDFHYKGTKLAYDYLYDGNGNLSLDNNKAIDHIHYDYLNLPDTVHMNGKGTICYSYDAGGNKLKKVTLDSTSRHSTTTLYLDGFVYQQSDTITNPGGGIDTLQFMGHEEGRARWAYHKYLNGSTAYGWEYDFLEKDHLGNTRMLLSQEKDSAQYLASMEAAYRNTENALFYNIPQTSYPRASATGYPVDVTVTNPNDSVIRVNGSGQKVGPAIILKVMSGDKVDIGVNYYYNSSGATNGQSVAVSDIINSLASGIVNLTGPAHGSVATLTGGSSPLQGALSSYLTNNNPTTTGKPNAYLNWILLDDQFSYVSSYPQSGAIQVGASGTQSGGILQTPLGQTGIPITKSGYLYIYVSNATPGWDVFFDNLSVKTYSGPVLEENHYYPFGLTMAGISDKALKTNYAQNKYRYNGKELQNQEFSDGTGLENYDYGARMLDFQIGRWTTIDPMFEKFSSVTPYNYCLSNPSNLTDPDGMQAVFNWDDGKYYDNGQEVSFDQVQQQYDIGDYTQSSDIMIFPATDKDGHVEKDYKPDYAITDALKIAKNSVSGSVKILQVKDINDAVNQITNLNGIIDNILIASHGAGFKGATAYFGIGETLINSADQINHTYSKQFDAIASKLSQNAEIVLMACHAGSAQNQGIQLISALAKKLNATVYGNQSWGVINNGMFNEGFLQKLGINRVYQTFDGVPNTHSSEKQRFQSAIGNEGKWTKATPDGDTETITNVYFDSFGKIHYD